MSRTDITLVPAGAGAGKTFRIKQSLGEWVVANRVRPERIAAVTFTEAAASELRGRIRTELLTLGRIEDALRLDGAWISTLHGFGLRLLTEYAFEAGVSPAPRLLNDDEKSVLIRLVLARSEAVADLAGRLAHFGYRYDFNSGKGPEDQFRGAVLDVVERLRRIGWSPDRGSLVKAAQGYIRTAYGRPGKGAGLTTALEKAVAKLLRKFPESLAPEAEGNATATSDLRRDFSNLCRAKTGVLEQDWFLWQALRGLRTSNRRTRLPEPYDELAGAVMEAADRLPGHPGPRDDALLHAKALLGTGESVLGDYQARKRDSGLVDYMDMIAGAASLLRERPDVLYALRGRIDCLVIDEFQDTNPLQFDLVWRLAEAGVPALIVGDLKQAIMGFQGADPRLQEALEAKFPDRREPLLRNWRSQAPLMAFINAIGPGLFGDAYQPLVPQRPKDPLPPLAAICFPKAGSQLKRAVAIAEQVRDLLQQDLTIPDRLSKRPRPLHGSDIAILAPRHEQLQHYASALRAAGLRVRLREEGWYSSRAVEITRHALAYVANPADRHAALYLAVTELGNQELQPALEQLLETGSIDDPLLARLKPLTERCGLWAIDTLIGETLAVLGIHERVANWPDAARQRANLLRLEGEAREFLAANREALAAGGFHGSGLPTFLAWLAHRAEEDDGQPDARVRDAGAIELVTWHSAKGREWPITVVAGLHTKVQARLPSLEVAYADFDNLGDLLEGAGLRFSPDFAAPESARRFSEPLQEEAEKEARRLLYVAMTRAREQLLIEWPEWLAGKDATTYYSILAGACEMQLSDRTIAVGEILFDCPVTQAQLKEPDENEDEEDTRLPFGLRAIRKGEPPVELTPDSLSPSAIETAATPAPTACNREKYGPGLSLDIAGDALTRGSVLHRAFELLGRQPDLAPRLPELLGITMKSSDIDMLAKAVADFESWVQDHFQPTRIRRELPILGMRTNGAVITGIADLVIETERGLWVIDHKSGHEDDPDAGFDRYWPQLEAYADVMKSAGVSVLGVGVNWISRGVLVLTLM